LTFGLSYFIFSLVRQFGCSNLITVLFALWLAFTHYTHGQSWVNPLVSFFCRVTLLILSSFSYIFLDILPCYLTVFSVLNTCMFWFSHWQNHSVCFQFLIKSDIAQIKLNVRTTLRNILPEDQQDQVPWHLFFSFLW
jgi:hypothetical protein